MHVAPRLYSDQEDRLESYLQQMHVSRYSALVKQACCITNICLHVMHTPFLPVLTFQAKPSCFLAIILFPAVRSPELLRTCSHITDQGMVDWRFLSTRFLLISFCATVLHFQTPRLLGHIGGQSD